MTEKLLISEVFRFPSRKHEWQMRFIKPKVYFFNAASKRILKKINAPEAYFDQAEYSFLRNCYHYNGARGITSGPDCIYIGLQNRIVAYDISLEKILFNIDHPLLNGIHELDYFEGKLYVTCAVTDSIVVFNSRGGFLDAFHLGLLEPMRRFFSTEYRALDSRLDYRVMHKIQRLYHVNNVQVSDKGVFVNLNRQGALVQLKPRFKVLVASPEMKFSHNGCLSPDGKHILVNDTANYTLRVFTRNGESFASWDLRDFNLPIDFKENRTFEGAHRIRAGWLRGLDFSKENSDIVYLGLSPAMVAAFDFKKGRLLWYHRFRRNIWASIHGVHAFERGE